MPRSALPQKYIKNEGTVGEEFENVADWSITGNGSLANNTSEYRSGSTSMKASTLQEGQINTYIDIAKYLSPDIFIGTGINGILLWFYIHDDLSKYRYLEVRLGTSNGQYMKKTFYLTSEGEYNYVGMDTSQWQPLYLHRDDFTSVGGETWDNLVQNGVHLIFFRVYTWYAASISFDSLAVNPETGASLILRFDDGFATDYTTAYPLLAAAGMKAMHYICPAYVESGNPDFMTLAQCQELYAAGYDISNHTYGHTLLATVDLAMAETAVSTAYDWLLANGFTRSARHLAYPGGSGNIDVQHMLVPYADTGDESNAVIMGQPFNMYFLPGRAITNDESVADVIPYVDSLITQKKTGCLMFHSIDDVVDPYHWPASKLEALLAYIESTKIKVVTMHEWYKGLTNPRYRSLPLLRAEV